MIVLIRRFSNVIVEDTETCPCLESAMGNGGGNIPMIIQDVKNDDVFCIDQGGGKSSVQITIDLSPTLTTTHDGTPVVIFEKDKKDE